VDSDHPRAIAPCRFRLVTTGVTRSVVLTPRWAIKLPWGLMHSIIRGWLANRSEWRQRDEPGVCRPIFTLAHLVLVMPRADEVGDDTDWDNLLPNSGPWDRFDLDQGDSAKPSSWGRFGDEWVLIDFEKAWDVADRGWVGRLYYGRQERLARKWTTMDMEDADAA
jgi:hypothetical protein